MKLLTNLFSLLVRLLASAEVAWQSKAFLLAGLVYIVSPIDAIPDWIPLFGWLEDATVLLLILDGTLNHLPADLLNRHWNGNPADLARLQKKIARLSWFVPKPLRWWIMKRAFSGTRRPLVAKVMRMRG